MAYPATKETFTDPSASDPRNSPSHAGLHTSINGVVEAIQDTIGTTAGTSIARNFAAGDFAARINGSNVLQQAISGTINNAIVGTSIVQGGTANNQVVGSPAITGGTTTNQLINTATLGTPTIQGSVAVSGTVVPLNIGAGLAPTVVTLTDAPSGTIALNAQAAQIFHMILGTTAGNRTFGTPANATEGQSINFRLKQNSNNTGTIVWPAIYRFNLNGTPTLGTTSSYNYYSWRYNTIDTKWDFQGNSGGLV